MMTSVTNFQDSDLRLGFFTRRICININTTETVHISQGSARTQTTLKGN